VKVTALEVEATPLPPQSIEPALDEETQRYVTQSLTDVDLFSSYGLTQKAIDLLETVLERAPQHSPLIERLLDLSVGAGNDQRTAELAAMLEQLAIARKDHPAADKYSEFRRRFQRAAGLPPVEAAAPVQPPAGAPPEFSVPTIEAQLDEPVVKAPAKPAPPPQVSAAKPAESIVHEVDLSDEWAALSEQLDAETQEAAEAPVEAAPAAPKKPAPPLPVAAPPKPAEDVPEEEPAFEVEQQHPAPAVASQGDALSADALLADLALELESATSSLGIPEEEIQHKEPRAAQPSAMTPATPPARQTPTNGAPAPASSDTGALSGPLGDLFEEFRSEMGEMSKDDKEDPETHYNLGIAYREMGLLEEAISEFQKVAKSTEKGPTFRYAMQCCTLLGLAFVEKGQPGIAAIWYERALQTPGLDQESILALRYDLGVAQEMAGDKAAAIKSFSQVYAMNIDYRDVSERISTLGKAR
jgi:tetratricopeptide (TPR) repeat protein